MARFKHWLYHLSLALGKVFNLFVPQLLVFPNCVGDYTNEYIYVLCKVPVIHSGTQNLSPGR